MMQDQINKLKKLRVEFQQAANNNLAKMRAVDSAIKALEQGMAAPEAFKAKELALEFVPRKKHNFIFLVDGSSSMGFSVSAAPSGTSKRKATALEVAIASIEKTVNNNKNYQTANFLTGLFGNKFSATHWLKGEDNPKNGEAALIAAFKNLSGGTFLAPSITDVKDLLAAQKLSRVKQHMVIVSDGDLFDSDESYKAIMGLLNSNKSLTIDFVLAKPTALYSQISKLEEKLKIAYGDRIGLSMAYGEEDENIFKDIIKKRTVIYPKAKKQNRPS